MPEPLDPSRAAERATLYGFRRNLVVVASAGTGKTHALVGVLVHMALGATASDGRGLSDPIPLSRVVATTFSRKAAAEIRARLVRELTRLASADPDAAYRADLLAACERANVPRFSEDELAARARRALDGVSDARIGTLHGQAATLVRTYGLAAGLSPRFEVEDEDASEARAQEAASLALEELLAGDEAGARDLLRLAGGVGLFVERVAALLGRLAEDGRSAASLRIATDDARLVEGRLETLVAHARRLCKDSTLGGPARAVCEAWDRADTAAVEEAVSDLCGVAARGRTADAGRDFFEFRATLPGSSHGERGRNLVRLFQARHGIAPCAEVFKSLLVRAEETVRATMLRDGVLGYGAVLRAARDILATSPAAARDFGRGLDALLVDEFQDTSRVQRSIVELAWQETDAPRGGADAPVPLVGRVRRRGLLVVGDRKQSIYAFRGADVATFAGLCIGLAGARAREALRIPPGRVWEPEEPIADFVALRDNRRSAPEILAFVNAYSAERLMASGDPPELYEIQYAPSIEDLASAGDGAWQETGAPRVAWIPVPPGKGPASPRTSEADVLARAIGRMLESGVPRVRGAPPRPRDIAVLAVRNAMLDATAYALARAGIPYVVAGNGFYAAREVKDMLAMLAFVVDPEDVLARVEVLRGVWCAASDETLAALTDPYAGVADIDAWNEGPRRAQMRPEDRPRVETLQDVVRGLRGASATIGPAETLRQAARALELEETLLLLPRGEQRVANVRKLIGLAEGETDARAFVDRLTRAADEERPEPEAATFSEEDDAVRLLTVHASKGLDFPIVFLPEAGANPSGPERSPFVLSFGDDDPALAMRALDADGRSHETPSYAAAFEDATRRDFAEWARLGYVAATRAREAVVFVGDRRAPKGAPSRAFRSTAAATLNLLTEDPASGISMVKLESLTNLHGAARAEPRVPAPRSPPPAAPPAFGAAMRAEELADFAVCARRFELLHVVDLPEPARPADGFGAAGAIEDYVRRAGEQGARVERSRTYLLSISAGPVSAAIAGTIDAWIERPDGATESVLGATEPGAGAPRTAVLAELAALAEGERLEHKTGIVGRGGEVAWRVEYGPLGLYAAGATLAQRVKACVEARWTRAFPRAPIATCRAIGCGYVPYCHPAEPSSTDIPPRAR